MVSQMYEWMDGLVLVIISEIVFMVSQMYGWMDEWMDA